MLTPTSPAGQRRPCHPRHNGDCGFNFADDDLTDLPAATEQSLRPQSHLMLIFGTESRAALSQEPLDQGLSLGTKRQQFSTPNATRGPSGPATSSEGPLRLLPTEPDLSNSGVSGLRCMERASPWKRPRRQGYWSPGSPSGRRSCWGSGSGAIAFLGQGGFRSFAGTVDMPPVVLLITGTRST